MNITDRGFTIVELLIVLIIIGVLATLAVFTFTDMQRRAANGQTVSAVIEYKEALLAYAKDKGAYPLNYGRACLGHGYPDLDGNSTADCEFSNGSVRTSVIESFDVALLPYMSEKASPNDKRFTTSWGHTRIGIMYFGSPDMTLDGNPQHRWLFYHIDGKTTKCPVGPVVSKAASGWPDFVSAEPQYVTEDQFGTGGACYIPLPDPSKL